MQITHKALGEQSLQVGAEVVVGGGGLHAGQQFSNSVVSNKTAAAERIGKHKLLERSWKDVFRR